MTNKQTIEGVAIPSKRIDEHGNERSLDSPYELGVYCSVIGLYRSDNPFRRDDKFNRRRWLQGYNDHQREVQGA